MMKVSREFRRKIKILAAVAAVVVLVSGALLVWAGIALVSSVADVARNNTIPQVSATLAEIPNLPDLENVQVTETAVSVLHQGARCWDKAVSLTTTDVLVTAPLAQHLTDLQSICLEGKLPVKAGSPPDELESESEIL